MSSYKLSFFPEPSTCSKKKINVELDLSNYATKFGLKNAAGADASIFAKKADLASLKSDINKLDIDGLEKFPSGLSNLRRNVDKWDIGKLEITSSHLSRLTNIEKNWSYKDCISWCG